MDDFGARSDNRRHELGHFLKARRARLKPADLGLKPSPRRRAVGLLREEVASAAGMSATWYTWMEQGRPTNPSLHLLERLARVLKLDPVERAHLFQLARPDAQTGQRPPAARQLDPSLALLLRGLHPHPAYAFDVLWNVIAWNEAAAALLGAFDMSDPLRGNVLIRLFCDPAWRRLFTDWEAIAQSAVAQYRAQTAALHRDPRRHAILSSLQQANPRFAALWRAQDVAASPAWRKVLDHPER
ncbi:MAG TPA: helix-turn-helix transcriptional regulator, partial [Nordella sp.]|nr:helix-turn-helix transcriptional regulator [Nordella sp.]